MAFPVAFLGQSFADFARREASRVRIKIETAMTIRLSQSLLTIVNKFLSLLAKLLKIRPERKMFEPYDSRSWGGDETVVRGSFGVDRVVAIRKIISDTQNAEIMTGWPVRLNLPEHEKEFCHH